MRHFLFEDYDTSEYFIVGADDMFEANEIAGDNFTDPHFVCEYTEEEAEMSGLDEY